MTMAATVAFDESICRFKRWWTAIWECFIENRVQKVSSGSSNTTTKTTSHEDLIGTMIFSVHSVKDEKEIGEMTGVHLKLNENEERQINGASTSQRDWLEEERRSVKHEKESIDKHKQNKSFSTHPLAFVEKMIKWKYLCLFACWHNDLLFEDVHRSHRERARERKMIDALTSLTLTLLSHCSSSTISDGTNRRPRCCCCCCCCCCCLCFFSSVRWWDEQTNKRESTCLSKLVPIIDHLFLDIHLVLVPSASTREALESSPILVLGCKRGSQARLVHASE